MNSMHTRHHPSLLRITWLKWLPNYFLMTFLKRRTSRFSIAKSFNSLKWVGMKRLIEPLSLTDSIQTRYHGFVINHQLRILSISKLKTNSYSGKCYNSSLKALLYHWYDASSMPLRSRNQTKFCTIDKRYGWLFSNFQRRTWSSSSSWSKSRKNRWY